MQLHSGEIIESDETDFIAAFKDVQSQYQAQRGKSSLPIAAVIFSGKGLDYLRYHFDNVPMCSPKTIFTGALKEHILLNLEINLMGPAWGVDA